MSTSDYAMQQVDAFNSNLRHKNYREAVFRLAMAAMHGINAEKIGEMCERLSATAHLTNSSDRQTRKHHREWR